MPIEIPGRRGGILKMQQKGDPSSNPNGRPKLFVTLLKEQGYDMGEIIKTIQNMLAMERDELKLILKNDRSTVLELTIASAIVKSVNKGSLLAVETLMNRAYGKPIEYRETKNVNSNINENIEKTLSSDPVEAAKQYKEIMQGDS